MHILAYHLLLQQALIGILIAMHIQKNVALAPYTSFQVGGEAEYFAEVHSSEELVMLLQSNTHHPIWLLGYGSNTLISDNGLPGLTVCIRGGNITVNEDTITAGAGVWWDDIVKCSIENNLWGVELMSEIPGSFGAALFINITAYGQSVGPLVNWIDIWNEKEAKVERLERKDLLWGYKSSVFQTKFKDAVILQAKLHLSPTITDELSYQKAVDVAEELNLDVHSLEDRRKIIIEARNRAGSLWHPDAARQSHTVGSFFKNPIVSAEIADKIISYDESGKTKEQIMKMNQVHGGDSMRVSAAHVMLAAGFKRNQQWDNVKLNEKNLLKIEALPGATASDVYRIVVLIQETCRDKLGVELVPEARLLGSF